MQRRYWLGVGLAVVLAVAVGWVALISLSGLDGGYYLDAAPADGNVSANDTIAYETLSPEQRRVFESAVNADSMVEIPDSVDENVFIDNRYVSYENRTYEVMVASSD
jgi:hypothetical protein